MLALFHLPFDLTANFLWKALHSIPSGAHLGSVNIWLNFDIERESFAWTDHQRVAALINWLLLFERMLLHSRWNVQSKQRQTTLLTFHLVDMSRQFVFGCRFEILCTSAQWVDTEINLVTTWPKDWLPLPGKIGDAMQIVDGKWPPCRLAQIRACNT